MRLLLDTHVLLWWLSDSPKLSKAARAAIQKADLVYVSAATAREIGIQGNFQQQLPLDITIAHAEASARLPPHHHDPFDRMLVAQAALESLELVSSDARMGAYGVPILPA